MKLVTILALLAATGIAVADDKVTAASAFRAAKELEKAGKLAEACPLYETSYRADPQLGALLNLANCHDLIGRTATAWVEFSDALELATRRGDSRVDYAKAHLAALEPRLSRLWIDAPPGVVVERNGTDVSTLLRQDLAVDPGTYVVRATQPGKVPWEATVSVTEPGHTTRVEVPVLAPLVVASVAAPPPAPVVKVPAAPPPPPPERTSHRRTLALTLGGVGLASAAVGIGFGWRAHSQWQGSRASCDAQNVCNASGTAQIEAARSSARIATWSVGAGASLLVAAGVVWLTSRTEREVAIVPAVDATGASISAVARF